MKLKFCLVSILVLSSGLTWAAPYDLKENEKLITILATNDIHGGIEPTHDKRGAAVGGMAIWSGIVRAIRRGVREQYGDSRAGVLLVDGGDQFQGTLISNYNEGALVISLLKRIGYDAIVPGNHDFDFGPKGWLIDQSSDPTKRREVLEGLIKKLDARMIAANDFYRTFRGAKVDENCNPTQQTKGIWQPTRPKIFEPFRIVRVADGVRVALIGLDNYRTSLMTTKDNVADLCFADEFQTYKEVRKSLDGKADIFVIVAHDGDANNDHNATKLIEAIQAVPEMRVDAVVSAHTHFTYNQTIQGVPLIQSGSKGSAFGRIDLIWNEKTRQVVQRTSFAGVKMYSEKCDQGASHFCQERQGTVFYDGAEVILDRDLEMIIQKERETINRKFAKVTLGEADQELTSDRINESPAMNFLTDALLAAANSYLKQHPTPQLSKVDVAFYNTGGIKGSLPKGIILYEDLFRALPFNNHAWALAPMSVNRILDVLRTSIKTCGIYGAILPSGLRVSFTRDCGKSSGDKSIDPKAALVRVTTTDGKILFPGKPQVDSLVAVTLDFLAAGGEGGQAFVGVPNVLDFGIARERIKDLYERTPFHTTGSTDGRWNVVKRNEQ